MRKTLAAAVLTLSLAASAAAGVIECPPPAGGQIDVPPAANGAMDTRAQGGTIDTPAVNGIIQTGANGQVDTPPMVSFILAVWSAIG